MFIFLKLLISTDMSYFTGKRAGPLHSGFVESKSFIRGEYNSKQLTNNMTPGLHDRDRWHPKPGNSLLGEFQGKPWGRNQDDDAPWQSSNQDLESNRQMSLLQNTNQGFGMNQSASWQSSSRGGRSWQTSHVQSSFNQGGGYQQSNLEDFYQYGSNNSIYQYQSTSDDYLQQAHDFGYVNNTITNQNEGSYRSTSGVNDYSEQYFSSYKQSPFDQDTYQSSNNSGYNNLPNANYVGSGRAFQSSYSSGYAGSSGRSTTFQSSNRNGSFNSSFGKNDIDHPSYQSQDDFVRYPGNFYQHSSTFSNNSTNNKSVDNNSTSYNNALLLPNPTNQYGTLNWSSRNQNVSWQCDQNSDRNQKWMGNQQLDSMFGSGMGQTSPGQSWMGCGNPPRGSFNAKKVGT